jgi:hypothetical protein
MYSTKILCAQCQLNFLEEYALVFELTSYLEGLWIFEVAV